VAVVSVPPELEGYKEDIAQAITAGHRNIRTVLCKTSKLEGNRRVAAFELLAGDDTITMHREFGFSYKLDVAKVFFNSHLAYERNRVASKVRPGETVLVPFCGVGPFAIPLAAKGAAVFAIESNPEACRWLAENARLNKVEDRLAIIKADAFSAPGMLRLQFDRAVIPTPYGRDEILDAVAPMVKSGGAVHFYTFKKRYQIEGLVAKYEGMGFQVEHFRKCGNVAPGVCRWAFDLLSI
jgi:tRNA (guanine37-N1)-methyltransferase